MALIVERLGQQHWNDLEPATGVNLFVCNGRDILLLWRSHEDASRPGGSDLPGGAVDPGEGEIAAIVRETCEEVGTEIGLSLSGLKLVYSEVTPKPDVGINLTRLYFQAVSLSRRVYRSSEHVADLWTPRQSLDNLLTHEPQRRAWHSFRNSLVEEQPDDRLAG